MSCTRQLESVSENELAKIFSIQNIKMAAMRAATILNFAILTKCINPILHYKIKCNKINAKFGKHASIWSHGILQKQITKHRGS